MEAEKKRPFPRRLNSDGSYDLICPRCFLTVVRGVAERELEAAEKRHTCERWELRRKSLWADEDEH